MNQNYPNPFNPNTIINYTIPLDARGETQDVKLIVYNSLGMLKATLVDEKQNAGNYNVPFNGNNLSSGVYFYKLVVSLSNPIEVGSQSGTVNFTETKQMILLK
ncbi:MAG: T9SS type A sorting domain-containing protein [Ignavibacteria bacterium]|nr:T9SS type A sorting domain-containing protein [Ignavibacteria bacterium]